MSLKKLIDTLPGYADDIRYNLISLKDDTSVTDQQKYGLFFVSALASGNSKVIQNILDEVSPHLSENALTACKASHALMSMNNVYYRFLGLVENQAYRNLPAGLKMDVLADPGVNKGDFELWCLAVSTINACVDCINAHEKELINHQISFKQIQTAVKIASVIKACSAILQKDGLN